MDRLESKVDSLDTKVDRLDSKLDILCGLGGLALVLSFLWKRRD